MACTSTCPTRDCASYGECLRRKALQLDTHGLKGFRNLELDKDRRLTRYEDARRQGLHPKNTTWPAVRDAFEHGGVGPTPITQSG